MADFVVVGSGPNGLAAAITIARAGRSVLVLEQRDEIGGGARSAQLTEPGFVHDVCSAVHPLAAGSPFMATLPLSEYGVEWVYPPVELAHPLDDGTSVLVRRSVDETASQLGADAGAYRRLMGPFVRRWDALAESLFGPILRIPPHPFVMARFGLRGMWPARRLAKRIFRTEPARAVFAGMAAHAILPLEHPLTSSFGILLGAPAHAIGWPVARGGSQKIVDGMAAYLRSLGGEIETGRPVRSLADLSYGKAVLFDVTPRQLLSIAGEALPASYRKRLARFRYGPGVFKVDYALSAPVPWKNPDLALAGTVHVGGSLEDIALSEALVAEGRIPERPFVLVSQPSLFDPTRAPRGKHTLWAYCHAPHGSASTDALERIEAQIERFAPGFRDVVIARATMTPAQVEAYNPNYPGGDISSGAHDGLQLFARPVLSPNPYATPARGIYLCSASTPPGAGVHGMCGYWAARAALRKA